MCVDMGPTCSGMRFDRLPSTIIVAKGRQITSLLPENSAPGRIGGLRAIFVAKVTKTGPALIVRPSKFLLERLDFFSGI